MEYPGKHLTSSRGEKFEASRVEKWVYASKRPFIKLKGGNNEEHVGGCSSEALYSKRFLCEHEIVEMFVYKHKHEKKICDKLLRKDLSKVDSGPKTRSVQRENL